jgi:ubiquinone biosynthesis protein COQ9
MKLSQESIKKVSRKYPSEFIFSFILHFVKTVIMNSSSVIRATREFAPVLHSSAAALRVMSSQIQRSTYHSYQHPSPPPFSDVSKSILSAALARVPEHGFTQDSLRLGAKDVGYLSVSTNLFPQGVFDLILYYLASKRLALHDVTNSGNGYAQTWQDGKPGVGSRVRTLMLDRLRMNGEAGVVKRWPEVR